MIGGVGVMAKSQCHAEKPLYSIDRDTTDTVTMQEIIALAAGFSFGAPSERRADRITAGGKVYDTPMLRRLTW